VSTFHQYAAALQQVLADTQWDSVSLLAQQLKECRKQKKQVFLCGNGGSAANAMHIANDLMYVPDGKGIKAFALTANSATITCIANDIDYNDVFSYQIATQGEGGDLLIALSGSGNSENIIRAIHQANQLNMDTFALLGFDGGACKKVANRSIHFPIDDMQISEDLQLIVGHMLMRAIV